MKRKLVLSTLLYALAAMFAIGTFATGAPPAPQDDEVLSDVPLDEEEVVDVEHVAYRVRITNLTKGQPFSRIVLATHRPGLRFFALGREAPRPLVALAEHGNPLPLARVFRGADGVRDVAVTETPLGPGESVVVMLRAGGRHTRLSVAGMLTETNDGFFALNGARGPLVRRDWAHVSPAFDAGARQTTSCARPFPDRAVGATEESRARASSTFTPACTASATSSPRGTTSVIRSPG